MKWSWESESTKLINIEKRQKYLGIFNAYEEKIFANAIHFRRLFCNTQTRASLCIPNTYVFLKITL